MRIAVSGLLMLWLASFDSLPLAQDSQASWRLVVDGYHRALEKGGIVGSSLMVVRDGRLS